MRSLRRFSVIAFLAVAAIPLCVAQSAEAASAVRSAPVDVGDLAPDFTLLDEEGRAHTLSNERAKQGAVVLIFYRGHW